MNSIKCLYCGNVTLPFDKLPATIFMKTRFDYYQCSHCKLIQINPTPSAEILIAMYDSETYYEERTEHLLPLTEPLPGLRFSYQQQINNLPLSNKTNMLDFGCGDGHFIRTMLQNQYRFHGVEFNLETVENLRTAIPEVSFYTLNEFLNNTQYFELIRMSNVLEHFTTPADEISQIINKLVPGGYLVIEGPLEMNWSWTNWLKWTYLKFRKFVNKEYTTEHPPTHITFSNRKNQRTFFEQFPLFIESYQVKEAFWPFAEKWSDCKGFRAKAIYLFCIMGKSLFRSQKYGNTFLIKARKK